MGYDGLMRIGPSFLLLVLSCCLGRGAPLPVDVRNPSFEENAAALVPAPGSFTTNNVPQWTATGAGLFRPDTPLNFAADGIAIVFLNSGSLSQTLTFPGGAAVTASAGARLAVTLRARPRTTTGTCVLSVDARVGGASVATAPASVSLASNPTGYTAVAAEVTLKDSPSLGAAAGQPLSLVISSSGDQANIDQVSATITLPPVIVSLSASPQPAQPGQPVTVSWSVSGADSLTFGGTDATGEVSRTFPAPAVPRRYTLTATNEDGTATRSVLVDVEPAPLPPPAVSIWEVVSSNLTGLADEDGARQDWIELRNLTGAAIDLSGWRLTDDRAVPAKWTFGASIIPAHGHLVVFASGKNRITSPPHTNFRLSSEGEQLVLSDPAGRIVSVLDVPPLGPDRSYGRGIGPTRGIAVLSPGDAAMKWTVPAAPVGDAWRGGSAFDDSSWAAGQWPMGFNAANTTAYAIPSATVGTQSYAGALGMDFDVVRPVQITELGCFDSGANGLGRTITVVLWSRLQNGSPSNTADDLPGSVVASEVFTAAAPGNLSGSQRFKPLAAPPTLAPGSYTIVAYNYGTGEPNGNSAAFNNATNSGGGALAFVGTCRFGVTQPPASPAASWPGTPDGGPAARYGAGTFRFREPAAFPTNPQAAMLGTSASVFTRTNFTLAPDESPPCPILTVSSDDGFVAWLNGVEVARRLAPGVLDFNAAATASGDAVHSISLRPFAAAFRAGTNVLAIQGLNASASDTDFRLSARLDAETSGEIDGFLTTPTPGTANAAAQSAAGVVINEIHSDPTDSKSRFTEFVELFNPLDSDVDVGGWRLTGGIACTIPPGTVIPACGHLVLAENPAHLLTWFNHAGAIGPWTGSLRNEGEEIVLRRPDLSVADRVDYGLGFPWPTVGDDPGDSLQRLSERLDGNLAGSWRSAPPTPGARNAVAASEAPPAIRQVAHAPQAPLPSQAVLVTAKITDPDGVAAAWLELQTVDPGAYIRGTDPAYAVEWTTLALVDDGTGGDAVAGDDVFSALVPGAVQQHRRLVRYRIRTWDGALNHVRVPYADDDSPNFAWFCHAGVPEWTGAVQPGVTPPETFSAATMRKVRAWHLVADAGDVQNCQYNPAFNDGTYRFQGTLVVDGIVHDHIRFRIKGQNSTFNTGKNKWKFKFNRGRLLRMPDDYGLTFTTVRTLNISSVPAPWAPWNRGLHGLDEAMAFRLSALAGVPAPRTTWLHWRVIDGIAEQNPADQFDGDFWGLYLAFENTDNTFKDEHGMEDGNIFRLIGNEGGNRVLGQGKGQPGDLSDLNAFTSTSTGYRAGGGTATTPPAVAAIRPESWFRENVDLAEYHSWRAVTEAVNQTDRREQENVVYFRRPSDNRWQILPWDCDLLYENFDRWGPQSVQTAPNLQQYEQISRALLHPAILTEFQNRARELQDLLLNSDQAWKLVDEFVSIITDESPRLIPPGDPIADGFVEAERRRWDHRPGNPVPPRGAWAVGNYYRTPYPVPNMTNGPFPQPYQRVLASGDFEGMVRWVKEFIASGPNGGGRLARMADGEIAPYTLTATPAIQIPATPGIASSGPAGHPLNRLRFSSTAFSSPNGQAFAAIQWRLGEVSHPGIPSFVPGRPWRYEIEALWTSPETTAFEAERAFPATGLVAGRTYRARVRHKDAAGRWSHWSAPLEFIAGPPVPGNVATHLVVSEIMYNPPPPEGGDAEYIELMNIHPDAQLDLTGVQFTTGITWAFPDGTQLQPGARIVLARNAAVFTAKHGFAPFGVYGDSLNNGGERITLSLGAGAPFRTFTYDNAPPWPVAPDNGGASLVLIAPRSNPDHDNPANWRASLTPNPGGDDALTLASWLAANGQSSAAADADADGMDAFTEYAFGGDPAASSQTPAPTLDALPDGSLLLSVSRRLGADDVAWQIEEAADLGAWSPTPGTLVERREAAGTERMVFRVAPSGAPRRFVRIRLAQR